MARGTPSKLSAMRRAQRGEAPRTGQDAKWVRVKDITPKLFRKLWRAEEDKEARLRQKEARARKAAMDAARDAARKEQAGPEQASPGENRESPEPLPPEANGRRMARERLWELLGKSDDG